MEYNAPARPAEQSKAECALSVMYEVQPFAGVMVAQLAIYQAAKATVSSG